MGALATLPLVPRILLLSLVLFAAAWDYRTRRIPNWLTAPLMLAGIVLDWKPALLGIGLALLCQLPFFATRYIGAGDVKLMAAAGALAGPMNWLFLFAVSSILSGAGALWQMRRGKKTLPRAPFVAVAALLLMFVT